MSDETDERHPYEREEEMYYASQEYERGVADGIAQERARWESTIAREQFQHGKLAGASSERARIVAWLRDRSEVSAGWSGHPAVITVADSWRALANTLERGEHLTESGNGDSNE